MNYNKDLEEAEEMMTPIDFDDGDPAPDNYDECLYPDLDDHWYDDDLWEADIDDNWPRSFTIEIEEFV